MAFASEFRSQGLVKCGLIVSAQCLDIRARPKRVYFSEFLGVHCTVDLGLWFVILF